MSKHETQWDVLVIGAGPAGASAATVLADHGHRFFCVLLDGDTPAKGGDINPGGEDGMMKDADDFSLARISLHGILNANAEGISRLDDELKAGITSVS